MLRRLVRTVVLKGPENVWPEKRLPPRPPVPVRKEGRDGGQGDQERPAEAGAVAFKEESSLLVKQVILATTPHTSR